MKKSDKLSKYPDMYYKPLHGDNVQTNEKLTFKKMVIRWIKGITLKDVLIFPFWLSFHILMLPFHMIIWLARLSEMLSEIPVIGYLLMFLPSIAIVLIVLYLKNRI